MKKEFFRGPSLMQLPGSTIEEKLNGYRGHCAREISFTKRRTSLENICRYDAFSGILKKISDMKLNGSLNSEELSPELPKSKKSDWKTRKLCSRHSGLSVCEPSNEITLEDDSSTSSLLKDNRLFLPCEEIPRARLRRLTSSPSPGQQNSSEKGSSPSRDDFPPPPSPIDVQCEEDEKKNWTGSQKLVLSSAAISLSKTETQKNQDQSFFSTDLNDNHAETANRKLSPKECGYPGGIADNEKHQLELFFKSLKTQVFVCGSLANLYFGWKDREGNWTYRHTGVVVIILDRGDTRSKRKRRIQILLAEKGTCFPLWKDTIDNLSAYHKSGTAFHTMHLSSDHRQIAGFSFDSPSEAEKLVKHIEELTSDPENINISVPGTKKKISRKKKYSPLPHKKQISNPCLFQHVTSVAAQDKAMYVSLQTLVFDDVVKKSEDSKC